MTPRVRASRNSSRLQDTRCCQPLRLREGRQLLVEQAPDLLIADVRLGRYNGLQLIATAPRAVSCITVTGFPDPALKAEALKFGAHYITKPIVAEAFLALVEETIVSARAASVAWVHAAVGSKAGGRRGLRGSRAGEGADRRYQLRWRQVRDRARSVSSAFVQDHSRGSIVVDRCRSRMGSAQRRSTLAVRCRHLLGKRRCRS